MEAWVKLVGGVALGFGGIFFMVLFGTLTGSLAGWVVGLFFSETMLGILGQLGVHNIALWQFGAFMGFTGGFLKTKVTCETK